MSRQKQYLERVYVSSEQVNKKQNHATLFEYRANWAGVAAGLFAG